jgi:hypothetical protein
MRIFSSSVQVMVFADRPASPFLVIQSALRRHTNQGIPHGPRFAVSALDRLPSF